MRDAKERLFGATQAISTAVMLLTMEREVMDEFVKEATDIDNFGHIVDLTLFRDPERRAAAAVVRPIFEAAVRLLDVHKEQMTRTKAALNKVRA